MTAATKPLGVTDVSLLAMETPVTPTHIGGGSLYRLPQGAGKEHVRRLYERWGKYPVNRAPFNYRLAPTSWSKIRPHWDVLDRVDLSQHFFHLALPYPGDDAALAALIGRLHSGCLKRERPLWEIYLIEGLSDQRFAMHLKIHHALVDGASAMRIFMEQHTEDPQVLSLPVWTTPGRKPKRPATKAPAAGSLLPDEPSTLRGAFKWLGQMYEGVAKATALASKLAKDLAQSPPQPLHAPDTIFNGPITARREMGQAVFDFSRVRTLSKTLGCTINDIALAVCSGALRRYLQGIDALPKDSLICAVPIALNKAGNAEGGNAITAAPVTLGTNIHNVRKRFDAIRASMGEVKARLARMTPEAIGLVTAAIQIPVIIEQISGRWPLPHRNYNIILSNVPGPRAKLYMCGAEFLGSIPAPMILRGLALNITITSLRDRIWFGYTACPDVAPHIDRLGPLLSASFEELESVMTRPQRRAPAQRKAKPSRRSARAKSAVRRRRALSP